MNDLVPFLIIGLTNGSLYGLAGLGLVLTYRTAGVFNFAHGTVAAASAYVFYTMHFTWGWPWPLAALIAVATFGAAGGVLLERLGRRLTAGSSTAAVVGTIGLLLFIQGLLYWSYGPRQRPFPEFLPTRTLFEVSGVSVTLAQAIGAGVGLLSFAGLYLYLRRARLGKAMRAVVANRELLSLAGTSPARVRTAAWMIGASFAALTGLLLAPTLSLNAGLLSALVVQAFGAVAIGRFASLPLTYAGGLLIGVSASVATKFLAGRSVLGGIPAVIPFIVLVVVLVATPPRALFRGFEGRRNQQPAPARLPTRTAAAFLVAGGGLLLAVPAMVGARLPVYTTALVFVVLFLSLSLLTEVSGQISLAHAAFAGVGAASFSRFTVDLGYPWLVALLAAGLVTGLVGILLALPFMRLSGIYLALATFGFGLLMENVLFQTTLLFGHDTLGSGLRALRPEFGPLSARSDTSYYFVVLGVVLVSGAALVALRQARLGRFLRAMADSPTGLVTVGLGVNVTRVIVFATSAFFAGVAGALFITQAGAVSSVSFASINSLLYLSALTIASALTGFLTAAVLASALLFVIPSYLRFMTVDVQSIIFGAVAVLAAVTVAGPGRHGVRLRLSRWLDTAVARSEGRRRRSPIGARPAAFEAVPGPPAVSR